LSLDIVGGGLERGGTAGADLAPGVGRGVGKGKQKLTISPLHIMKDMVPVGTSNIAPAVARNGQPKMRGTGRSLSMSRMTKSHGMRNLPT